MAAVGTWVGCQGPIEARIGLFGQPVPHTWSYTGPILPRFAITHRNLTLEQNGPSHGALMAAVANLGRIGPLYDHVCGTG